MTDFDQRALRTAECWLVICAERGHWCSPDNRVDMEVAAELVGLSHGRLRNLISSGAGPPSYRLGGGGHRRTVRLLDLAEWLESRRD